MWCYMGSFHPSISKHVMIGWYRLCFYFWYQVRVRPSLFSGLLRWTQYISLLFLPLILDLKWPLPYIHHLWHIYFQMGINWLFLLDSCKFWVLGSSSQPGSSYCGHLYVEQCCELYSKTLWQLTYRITSLVQFLFWSAWKWDLGPLLPHMFFYFCCTERV